MPSRIVSAIRSALQEASAPYLRELPVERWPALAGRLHGLRVPRGQGRHREKSPRGAANINILFFLLERTQAVPGDIAECGVFRGETFLPMGLYLKQHAVPKQLFGFDSFQGFGEAAVASESSLGGTPHPDKAVGAFADASYDELIAKMRRLGLAESAAVVPGYFRDSLKAAEARRFSFVHLDCDLYQSYKDCLEFFYPRLNPGGVILLDEYNDPPWPGCNKAVDEFLAGKPERLEEIERDNHQKWFFVRARRY